MGEQTQDTIPELKQHHTIVEKKTKFVHTVRVDYPRENVKNMLKSWKKAEEDLQEWLDHFEESKQTAIEEGRKQFDKTLAQKSESIKAFEAMSKEEKYKKLLEEFEKDKKIHEDAVLKAELTKNELEKDLIEEMNTYKSKVKQDLQNKRSAIYKWSHPIMEEQ